jgi:hypothetical protein
VLQVSSCPISRGNSERQIKGGIQKVNSEKAATYQIGHQTIDGDNPAIQKALGEIHGKGGIRPICMCRNPGIEMYVSKVGDLYVIKRMPDTGSHHDTACVSYEHPSELSGLGEIIGTAIQENVDEGTTALKFNFSLTKLSSGRASPIISSGKEKNTVKDEEKKLTLRSTLDYLWEEAGFHKWSPAMDKKRNWFIIRKYLLEAAQNKTAKGSPLGQLLFIPETFSVDQKDQILVRRNSLLSRIMKPSGGTRKMMVFVGEVKEMTTSRFGYKMMIKHLPDFPFMMSEPMYNKLMGLFEDTLTLWDAVEDSHLIAIGTFGMNPSGFAVLEEVGLMITNENWIPFEHRFELMLLNALTQEGRTFMKGLRYNLLSTRPFASMVLTDADPGPTAMYIVPYESEAYSEALEQLIEDSQFPSWVWTPMEEPKPPIPPRLT